MRKVSCVVVAMAVAASAAVATGANGARPLPAQGAGPVEVDDTPVLIDPALDDVSGPQVVSVRLSAAPVAERGSLRRVQRQQDAVLAAVGDDIAITEIARVDTVLNALFLEVDAADIDRLAADPRVERISLVRNYEMDLSDTVPYIGAAAVQLAGVDGHGVSVAVLDSGIDYTHAAFGGPGTIEAYEAAAGATASSPLAATRDSLFPTARVVGGHDYVGEAWDASTVTTLSPDDDPIDRQSHGTHVADIIGGIDGVAPGVDLHAVKVCSAVASACNGVAMVQGVEYAVDPNGDEDTSDHVDIVNLSLGSSYGSQFDDDMVLAIDNATALGVLSVASAGNSGDVSYVVGAPSVAETALSVAQTAMPNDVMDQLTVTAPQAIAGSYQARHQVWSTAFTDEISGPLQFGDGASNTLGCTPFPADSLTGKVVLVDRGSCNISVKVANVGAAGGLAALVGLIAPGVPGDFSLGDGVQTVPGFVIAQSTATALKGQLGTGVSVTLDPDAALSMAGQIVSTSSRGPSLDVVTIKPEIGAPGASVSAEVGTGTGTASFGGTSGAAPMVSGAAALLLDAHPERTPLEVKATLMNTADPDVTEADDVTPLPIARIGNGEVRVDTAVDAPVAAWSPDTSSGSLSFGFIEVRSPVTTLTRDVTVQNFTDVERTYTTSVAFRDPAEASSGAVTLTMPPTVTVPASGSTTFTVTMTIDGSLLPAWSMNAETGGSAPNLLTTHEVDGRIALTSESHTTRLAWHVLPRKSSHVRVVGSDLVNTGFVSGNTEVFHLIGTSPDAPDAVAGAQAPKPDLRAIGYRVVGNGSCSGQGQIEFAVQTWDANTFAGVPARVSLAIDVDRNGSVDGTLSDQRQSDVSQNAAIWFPTGLTTGPGDFFTEFVTNNDVRIMKICLGRLGLSLTTLRAIDVTPSIGDTWFTFATTDTMPTSTIDLFGGRNFVQVSSSRVGIVPLDAGVTVPITLGEDTQSESTADGLMLMPLLGGRAHDAIVVSDAPGAATGVSAVAGNASVALSWSAPVESNEVVPVYRVEWSTNGTDWNVAETTAALTASVTGLTNGTPHQFRVTATNVVGDGPVALLDGSVTPRTIPGAPQTLAGVAGNARVDLSWSAPASDGGSPVTGYRVERSTNGTDWTVAGTTAALTSSVTGLANGTPHQFRVTATNVAGDGPTTQLVGSVTPRTTPGAPTSVRAVAGSGRIDVSWSAPSSNGGSPVTGYRIQQSRNGGAWTTVVANTGSASLTRRITGLVNGTSYRFRIAAINVAGTGADSSASAAATPRTVPGAPTQATATAGRGRITVAWRAPASNGGAAITGYRIQQKIGSGNWVTVVADTTSTTTSRVFRNLDRSKTYRFRVAAINVAGAGAFSGQTAGVKPT